MTIFEVIRHADASIIEKIGGSQHFRKLARIFIGTVPGVGTVFMTIHVLFLLLGHEYHLAEYMFDYSLVWFLLLTILSISFEFCWVHRAFCAYNYIISMCIHYQDVHGFGHHLHAARCAAFLLGVFLIYSFFREHCLKRFIYKIKNQY